MQCFYILEWTKNLGNSIKIPTVSWNDTSQNIEELENLHTFLRETFPTVFNSPDIVQVDESLFYIYFHFIFQPEVYFSGGGEAWVVAE